MLEFLEPVATVIGYLVLIPVLVFVTILFLSAAVFVLYQMVRWWSGVRRGQAANNTMRKDLREMQEAMPDQASALFDSDHGVDRDTIEHYRNLVDELGEPAKNQLKAHLAPRKED